MKFYLSLFFLAAASLVKAEFPPAGNEWIAPKDDDVRSPCPFINTLANHGFIDRSGMNVDLFEMVNQLSVNFDVGPNLFAKLANGAVGLNFTTTDADGTVRMDINQLFAHNKQEHDASFVRADVHFGEEEAKLVDSSLLDAFLDSSDSSVLTKDDIMTYQRSRILDSRRNNPEHMFSLAQSTSFSAQATLFLTFGQDPELGSVDKKRLEEFLKFERFPEGYKPRNGTEGFVPIDVIAEGTLANDIRLEFVESFEGAISEPLNTPDVGDVDAPMADDEQDLDSSGEAMLSFKMVTAIFAASLLFLV